MDILNGGKEVNWESVLHAIVDLTKENEELKRKVELLTNDKAELTSKLVNAEMTIARIKATTVDPFDLISEH